MANDVDWLVESRSSPAAFEPLVDLHGPAVYAYLRRRSGDGADDLMAEVWLLAFGSRAQFDPEKGSVRGWLFGVARNVLLAHYRRRTPIPLEADAEQAADDIWQTVDERLDAAAVAVPLRVALAGLPPAERELVVLIAWEQLSSAEAAQALGIPAGTARSRLHRARTRMRTELTPFVDLTTGPRLGAKGLTR